MPRHLMIPCNPQISGGFNCEIVAFCVTGCMPLLGQCFSEFLNCLKSQRPKFLAGIMILIMLILLAQDDDVDGTSFIDSQ